MLQIPESGTLLEAEMLKSARDCGARRNQNANNISGSEHVWKLRCSKNARPCAKHVSKSKCGKHMKAPQDRSTIAMLKQCMSLWRLEVKSLKN